MIENQNNEQNTPEEEQNIQENLEMFAEEIKKDLSHIENEDVQMYLQKVLHDAVKEIDMSQFFRFEDDQGPAFDGNIPAVILQEPQEPAQQAQENQSSISQIQQIQEPVLQIQEIQVPASQVLQIEEPFQQIEASQAPSLQILDPNQFETNFNQDFTQLDTISVIQKYKFYLEKYEYFRKPDMKRLIKSKYPEASIQLLQIISELLDKLQNFLYKQDQDASQINHQQIENDLKPLFISIYQEQVQLQSFQVYQLMETLVSSIFPKVTIQKPLSLDQQQKKEFEDLTKLLPRLDMKYTIKEYSSLDQFSDFNDQISKLQDYFKKYGKLDGELVIKILFDFVKRRVNFKELLQELSKINCQNNLTQLGLFNYVLEHSNPQLKELLCITCASFIPLPFLSYNPWNSEQIETKMIGELLYILEKSKSILQFKLQQNKSQFILQKDPSGCTTLLNQLFGREFSLHQQNLINFGTVEIQMDLNCADVEHLVVADTHGSIDIQILEQIFPFFDGFIIHLTGDQSNNLEIQQILNKIYKKISGDQKRTILIIKHHEQAILDFTAVPLKKDEHKDLEIFEINTQNIWQLQENQRSNLISSIQKVLQAFYKIDADAYKANPAIRLQTKQTFLDILKLVNKDNCQEYQAVYDRLCQMIDVIQSQENLKGIDFLPMLNYKNKERKLKEKINNENSEQKIKFQAIQQLNEIKVSMENELSTQIINLYSDIVDRNECMKLLPSLSSIVKGFLESKLKKLEQDRDEKKELLLSVGSEEEKIQIEKQLKDTNQSIDEKQFSTELLNRELYYLGQDSKASLVTKKNYFQLVKHLESTAQPFELVDGDTLNFTSDVYQDIFKSYDNEDLLIVCVLGPQSSGKSLLMNYLFGTSFLSSSGRCTKGVYASVLNFKANNGSNKKIVILDTEGIQSSEARDSTFDKRIIYYAICISHVVLMCNRGEMNAPMSETIKLVADAIINTQMPFLKNPTIYIVLNMLANPNDKTVDDCIDEVQKALKELPQSLKNDNSINESQKLNSQVLNIDKESIIRLGFAFNTFQFGLNDNRTVNKPSPEFAMRTMNLRDKILQKFIEIESRKSTKYSLTDWFQHAQKFWAFSRDCKSLKDYDTLAQKRIDDQLLEYIERLIKSNYGEKAWQQALQPKIDGQLEEIFKYHQNGCSIKFQNIYSQIQTQIFDNYNEIFQKIQKDYEIFCNENQVGIDLRRKRQEILSRKKEQCMKEAERYCRQKLSKFIEQKSKVVGDTILQEKIIRLLKEKDEYSYEEAVTQFKISWQESIQQISEVIMKGEELTKTSIKTVQDEFNHAINQTPKDDQKYFFMAKNQAPGYWLTIIKDYYYKDALMFIGDQILPIKEQILEVQERKNKKYVDNQKMQIFENKTIYTYFEWWHACLTILYDEKLINQIASKLFQEKNISDQFNLWDDEKTVKSDFEKNVKIVLRFFKKECSNLGFKFKPEADIFTEKVKQFNFKDTEANKKVFLNDCKEIFNDRNNFECFELVNPFKDFNKYGNDRPSLLELTKQHNFQYFNIYDGIQDWYNIKKFYKEDDKKRSQQDGLIIDYETRVLYSQRIQEILENKQISQYGLSQEIPVYFDDYLDYLKDPLKNPPQNKANQAAQQYFFNAIQWEIVFKELETTVIKNFKVNGEVGYLSIQQYVEILSKNDQESEKLAQDFNKMSVKLARGISRDVNEIIKSIDEELEAFCMKISDSGKAFIFLVTQVFTFLLTEQLEIISESQPLRQFKIRKNNEKNLFIAKLRQNDSNQDKAWAMKFAEELCDYFYKESKLTVVRIFQDKMEKKKDEFRKDKFLSILEETCEMLYDQTELDKSYVPDEYQKICKRELLDYYFEPKKLLSVKFQQKFAEVSEEFIKNCKETFAKIYRQKIKKLSDYFQRILENLIKSNTNQSSGNLFIPEDNQELQKLIENKSIILSQLQKKAASTYLKYLLGDSWDSQSKLIVDEWDFKIYDDLSLPFASEIINTQSQKFDPEFHDYMAQVLEKGYEITQMHKFVESVISFLKKNFHIEVYVEQQNLEPQEADVEPFGESFMSDQSSALDISKISGIHGEGEENDPEDEQILNDFKIKTPSKKLRAQEIQIIKDEELVGEYYQDFRTKFMGCQEVCPLCKKQCEEDHDENQLADPNLIHDCKQGHYFQGFGGNKSHQTNLAITQSCNDLKDSDYVVYKGQSITWLEFKNTKLKNWNFDINQEKLEKAKKSQIKLWNLLGMDICYRFQAEFGLNIVFERAKDLAKNIHYILMFDQSYSMDGQPWDELIQAFKSFLSTLASNQGSKENSRLSLIKYNEDASLCFKEEVPDIQLIKKVRHEGGDTNFNKPLMMAYKLCEETHSKYEKIILYFMTDGAAKTPEQAINKFNKKSIFTKKLQFLIVGFGEEIEKVGLKQIGNSMPNGKVEEAMTVEELTDSFKKIVINDHLM